MRGEKREISRLFVRIRSRILEQNSAKQRENYFEKFLKILKVIHFGISVFHSINLLPVASETIEQLQFLSGYSLRTGLWADKTLTLVEEHH